jgi:hypothetical protein
VDAGPLGRGAAAVQASAADDTTTPRVGGSVAFHYEPALADARLAGDEHERSVAGAGGIDRPRQLLELLGATDEGPSVRRPDVRAFAGRTGSCPITHGENQCRSVPMCASRFSGMFTAETPVARPGNDRVLRCHASES